MGYFQVRYDSRVVNYKRILFIRLATDLLEDRIKNEIQIKLKFFDLTSVSKQKIRFRGIRGAGIAQWIRLRLPSC